MDSRLEFKGTKGEWYTQHVELSDFNKLAISSKESKTVIADLFPRDYPYGKFNEEDKANAKLIAAAPETTYHLQKTNKKLKDLIENDLVKGVGVIQSIRELIRENERQIKKALE